MSHSNDSASLTTHQAELEGRMDSATRLVRVTGALILLVSVSSFLVQRWDTGNDVLRYFFLLAHTVLLVFAALLCGGKLEEGRSARTFLWLALAVLPANYAVLGGLVYSQARLDSALIDLPHYATWQAPTLGAALLSVPITIAVGLLVTFLSSLALFRKKAAVLAGAFTLSNMMLLVPVRSANWAVLVAVAAAIGTVWLDRRVLSPHPSSRTLEGRLVRSLFIVPPVIIALRTVLFYETTGLFVGGILAALGLLVFLGSRKSGAEEPLELIGGSMMGAGTLLALYDLHVAQTLGMGALLPAVLVVYLAGRKATAAGSLLTGLSSAFAIALCAAGLFVGGKLFDASIAIVFGLMIAAVSTLEARWHLAVPGALLGLGGVLLGFELAIGFDHIANWGTLSFLGIAFIVLAAVIERNRSKVITMFQATQKRVDVPS
jgi:hypothetical protein